MIASRGSTFSDPVKKKKHCLLNLGIRSEKNKVVTVAGGRRCRRQGLSIGGERNVKSEDEREKQSK